MVALERGGHPVLRLEVICGVQSYRNGGVCRNGVLVFNLDQSVSASALPAC